MSYLKAEILTLIFSMIAYTAFIMYFLMSILRHFKRREALHDEQLLSEKYKAEKELFKAQLEIQEQTFLQVSREIHDNVGQFLSLAKLGLATLDLKNKHEAELGISEISDIIEKSISDLRDISKAMNADLVRKLGLKHAIESQVGFLQRAGHFQVQFECEGTISQNNPQKEVILYRILQESINNIIKHSSANEINILLSSAKNQTRLFIQDNGDGFDTELALAGSAMSSGINNMKGRAEFIDGEFSIESKIGHGTTITVTTTI